MSLKLHSKSYLHRNRYKVPNNVFNIEEKKDDNSYQSDKKKTIYFWKNYE